MQQNILSDLRKEQLRSLQPDRHVFRLTRKQEREIIDQFGGSMMFPSSKIEHIETLFGCRIELLD